MKQSLAIYEYQATALSQSNKRWRTDETVWARGGGGGGGGTPLYKLYRYVPPQRVWCLSRFGLKKGMDFDHYSLKLGMVFKGTTGA